MPTSHFSYGCSTIREFPRTLYTHSLNAVTRQYSLYNATLDEWIRILKIAQSWKFPEVKKLVARSLEQLEIGHVQKIVTYHEYGIDRTLLIPSYAALCARAEPISSNEGNALGMDTVLMLAAARERARCNPAARGPVSPAPVDLSDAETYTIIQDIFGLTAPDGDAVPPGRSAHGSTFQLVSLTQAIAGSVGKNKQINGAVNGKRK